MLSASILRIGVSFSSTPPTMPCFIKLRCAAQTAFVLVFPIVKLLMMNFLARYTRDMQDTRPEILVTNVEVFHALFSAYCVQGSTSSFTVAIIMGADAIHAWLSLRAIDKLNIDADQICSLDRQQDKCPEQSTSQFRFWNVWLAKQSRHVRLSMNPIMVTTTNMQDASVRVAASPNADETIRRLLHVTEFVPLVEYIEIIVPLIYGA